jgi:hypothetical protein
MTILESGSPDQLRARALRMLDNAGLKRRMAARLMRGAQRAEHEAIRLAALANARQATPDRELSSNVFALGPKTTTADLHPH